MTLRYSGPAYRIVTPRLVIRCWNPIDAPLLKAAVDENLDHLQPWMPWANDEPTTLSHKVQLLRTFRGNFDLGTDYLYGIFNLDETRVFGGTGLHVRQGANAREIGYWIDKEQINQGLATEVSAALTRVAFEIDGVDRVEIHCGPSNIRSASVPRKLGFVHEATLKRRLVDSSGEPRDTMIWTLFAADYPTSPAADSQLTAFDAAERQIM
jgi:RimJ/RimL family protein N-acetyltransferase